MATTLANPNNLALSSPTESSSQFVPSQASLTRTENPSLREGQRQQNIVSASTTSAGGLGSLFSQPAIQKALPAIIAFTTIFLILVAYSWAQGSTYRSVYPELSEADRQSAFEELSGADFGARIDSTTGGLQVPSDRYHEARLFLAARGLPKSSAAGGISALNDSTSMTTSQFMEQVRYISAIEQELAQSITNIATIESARVHLAAPKQSVFVRNRTPAKASVVVAPLFRAKSITGSGPSNCALGRIKRALFGCGRCFRGRSKRGVANRRQSFFSHQNEHSTHVLQTENGRELSL